MWAPNNLVQASWIHLSWWSQKMTASLDVLNVLLRCGKSEESKDATIFRAVRVWFLYSWLKMASRGPESATAIYAQWPRRSMNLLCCYCCFYLGQSWLHFEVHHTFWDIYIHITHEAAYHHHWACRMSSQAIFRAYIFFHNWQGKCFNLV